MAWKPNGVVTVESLDRSRGSGGDDIERSKERVAVVGVVPTYGVGVLVVVPGVHPHTVGKPPTHVDFAGLSRNEVRPRRLLEQVKLSSRP